MKKYECGVTLMEIVIVMVIVGVVAALAGPGFQSFINRGRLADAQNNLLTIYSAQKNKQASGSNYCIDNPCALTGVGNCTTTADLNTCLNISIVENNVRYGCAADVTTGFICTATAFNGTTFIMTLTNAAPVLTGLYNALGRNPRCTTAAATCN